MPPAYFPVAQGRNQPMEPTILPGPGPRPVRRARAPTATATASSRSTRALYLLENHCRSRRRGNADRLATRTGLNISTCHHLLATLIKRGFASKVPAGGFMRWAAAFFILGTPACRSICRPARSPIWKRSTGRPAKPFTSPLCKAMPVVTLAVREARHAVRVDTAQDRQIGSTPRDFGRQGHYGVAARGRDAPHRRSRYEAVHRQHHHGLSALVESLRTVRRNGYASIARSFCRRDLCRRGHPRSAGTVVGAISASSPSMRATEEHHRADARRDQRRHRALSANSVNRVRSPMAIGTGRRQLIAAPIITAAFGGSCTRLPG